LFWLWFRGRLDPVNVDRGLDMRSAHRPLLVSGAVVLVLGGLLLAYVAAQWDYIAGVVKVSGAAQAATVAAGTAIIGLALLYAGAPRRGQLPA
jgi:hypothetical protein